MARRSGPQFANLGYQRASEALNRLFSLVFASVLLIASAPLWVVIGVVILIDDGLPVFYSGWRLGRGKKLYRMFKFRTLAVDAQQRIGAELFSASLSSNRALLTRAGGFLRETRLDELPQLLNVLRGDMDILGPRPERPEIYEKYCKQIKGYDRRFSVKPGLIGYSQIFTPHSAPKRIRYLVDNKFLSIKHRYSVEVLVVIFALGLLSVRVVLETFRAVLRFPGELLRARQEKRALPRREPGRISVFLAGQGPSAGRAAEIEGTLRDVNEEAILVFTQEPVEEVDLWLRIVIPVINWHGRRVLKTVHCSGRKYLESASGTHEYRHRYVVKYTPLTPLNSYLMHQYLLDGSIVPARRVPQPAAWIKPSPAA